MFFQKTYKIRSQFDVVRSISDVNRILKDNKSILSKQIIDIIELVLSEMLTNIVKYAVSGTFEFTITDEKLIMKTKNSGNLDIYDFINGNSAKKTLGIGLGIIGRTADEFSYMLNPVEFTWIKYIKPKIVNTFITAELTEPLYFGKCCDKTIVIETPVYTFVALIDVAGHSKESIQLTKDLTKFIESHYFLQLYDLIACTIKFTENSTTKYVIECARFWKTKDLFEFCGVGDVSCKIFYKPSDVNHYLFTNNHERLLTKNGTLGGVKQSWMGNIEVITRNIPKKAYVLFFSDGISSMVSLSSEDFNKLPKEIIEPLLRKYKKEDDRSLIIVKCN